MAFWVENDVFWLEIPVNYTVFVQALQPKNNLCCVKSSSVFRKSLLFAQVEKKFPAIEKVNNEVKSLWGLKGKMKFNNKGVVDPLQDHSLD